MELCHPDGQILISDLPNQSILHCVAEYLEYYTPLHMNVIRKNLRSGRIKLVPNMNFTFKEAIILIGGVEEKKICLIKKLFADSAIGKRSMYYVLYMALVHGEIELLSYYQESLAGVVINQPISMTPDQHLYPCLNIILVQRTLSNSLVREIKRLLGTEHVEAIKWFLHENNDGELPIRQLIWLFNNYGYPNPIPECRFSRDPLLARLLGYGFMARLVLEDKLDADKGLYFGIQHTDFGL